MTVTEFRRTKRPIQLAPGEIVSLNAQLLEAGYSPAFTDGLIGWLQTGSQRASRTTASYRKALEEVGFSPPRLRRPTSAAKVPGGTSAIPGYLQNAWSRCRSRVVAA